ncbi:transporter substrate-binding domain-containing protein, partial [Legionella oakridgensis]
MKWFKFIVFPIIFYAYTSLVFADVIKVGTMIFYPPFVMSVNQGFDVDLIQSLCRRTNLQCQMVPMDFNKIFGALDSGAIDVAIGGIVITPERLNRYIFTTPYLLSKGEFLTLQDNNLQSITGLKGKS